jgi:glycosyltransferase involved in cell wall biosynthesis
MKVLLVSIEFIDPIFSGNGTACRCLLRSILSIPSTSIFVLCGCPQQEYDEASISHRITTSDFAKSLQISDDDAKKLSGFAIHLPSWYRTDIQSSFLDFANGTCSVAQDVASFDPDVSICIDWTGSLVRRTLRDKAKIEVPAVYFAFCCYSFLTGASSSDKEFYLEQEQLAMESSCLTIAMCSGDMQKLKEIKAVDTIKLLIPPLRKDFQEAVLGLVTSARRRFLTCCLRLHPSKNVVAFVEAVALLRDFLVEHDLVPVLCGAAADAAYAERCRSELRAAFPGSVVREDFLGPGELAMLLRETRLNVHTALYEPYGMTIIEAAAAGDLQSPRVPSCFAVKFSRGDGCGGSARRVTVGGAVIGKG